MKKRIISAVLLVALAAFCLGVLGSCSNSTVSFFEYSEDDLGLVGKLVHLMHRWIGNYGWTVVVFTVFLNILTLPLEFWQRYSSRKSALKMQRIQPLVEAIDKRYGANTQRANEEKQKLYKKQGHSMASMCLPMIVMMAIFFVMFGGLRNYSTYSSITSFQQLSETYYDTYVEQISTDPRTSAAYTAEHQSALQEAEKAENPLLAKIKVQVDIIGDAKKLGSEAEDACVELEAVALKAVQDRYGEIREGWLWIQNVWQPDTWATIMQPYEGGAFGGGGFKSSGIDMTGYPGGADVSYNKIRNAVLETGGYGKHGSWNGLMILPVLSVGLQFLSMFISQRLEKKNRKGEAAPQNQQQAASNKMMMIIFPLMMAYFGFIYTGAFAIYMVVRSSLSILTTLALRVPIEKAVLKRLDKDDDKNNSSKASYMR